VQFTFSEAMNPDATSAIFLAGGTTPVLTTPAWNDGDTILTCTPLTSFTANSVITWFVIGEDPDGFPLLGLPTGTFSTGTGGSTGGGTNTITTFSVGKIHHYQQTSAGTPGLDPLTPYGFSGVTALASNRTANSVTLTLPTTAVSNLVHLPPPSAEIFLMSPIFTDLGIFDATFPSGNYTFFVQAATSNQSVIVNLPTTASMPQPGAPHVTNYLAAQNVDPSKPFVLGWDAFAGGTTADYIDVDIGSEFGSANPGLPGYLNGTARTFTIPAGTLQPNTIYASQVGFFHETGATNSSYATAAYRATYTEFNLVTSASTAAALVLTNAVYVPGAFSFNVVGATGQTVVVEYKTNLSNVSWQPLFTTNSAPSPFHAVATQAVSNRFMFFRARNGP